MTLKEKQQWAAPINFLGLGLNLIAYSRTHWWISLVGAALCIMALISNAIIIFSKEEEHE